MRLDDYVFDSQFTYLDDSEALQREYKTTVLTDTNLVSFGEISGFFKKEEWDSNSLGLRVIRLLWVEDKITSNAQIYGLMRELNDFDCCYARVHQDHSFCEKALPLTPISTKVVQILKLQDVASRRFFGRNSVLCFSQKDKNDAMIERISNMAKGVFQLGRYRRDPRFPEGFADNMYRSWARNELKTDSSNLFFSEVKNKISGFIIYKPDICPLPRVKVGFVSLIAVDPDFYGLGLARDLLNTVISQANKDNTQYIVANTDAINIRALNFFHSHGFRESARLNEYHLWRDRF